MIVSTKWLVNTMQLDSNITAQTFFVCCLFVCWCKILLYSCWSVVRMVLKNCKSCWSHHKWPECVAKLQHRNPILTTVTIFGRAVTNTIHNFDSDEALISVRQPHYALRNKKIQLWPLTKVLAALFTTQNK